MNIPIYRAKKIDSDEYVIGFYSSAYDIHHYVITHLGVDTKTSTVYQMSTDIHKIDPTTLAISFDNGKSFIKLGDLEIHTCTDFDLKYTDMKMRNRQEKQPPNGNIFTIITDKGR